MVLNDNYLPFAHPFSCSFIFLYFFNEFNPLIIPPTSAAIPATIITIGKTIGIKAGALGGKLLGAGGGGFLLFYVEKDKQENVLKALDELMYVPFQFESEGSTVIHYNPIVYIPRIEIKID